MQHILCYKSVKCYRLGDCSPENDCLWWHWVKFQQPKRKSSVIFRVKWFPLRKSPLILEPKGNVNLHSHGTVVRNFRNLVGQCARMDCCYPHLETRQTGWCPFLQRHTYRVHTKCIQHDPVVRNFRNLISVQGGITISNSEGDMGNWLRSFSEEVNIGTGRVSSNQFSKILPVTELNVHVLFLSTPSTFKLAAQPTTLGENVVGVQTVFSSHLLVVV